MLFRAMTLPIVLSALATMLGAGSAQAGDDDSARVRRAIGYLDGRQDEWSRFASAGRGKGADRTTCVSCHTGLSFVLARDGLGRFLEKTEPAPAEGRIAAAVGLRVAHWEELDTPRFRLMYDSDERQKLESRGTEAVLNVLILARDDAARRRSSPSPVTRIAFLHLWAVQATEGNNAGSWDWLNFGLEPWEAPKSRAFGAALAALAVGSAPGYLDRLDDRDARGVRLLRDYLRKRFPDESLYNRLWILEASVGFKDLLSGEQRREILEQLQSVQREDGGWALSSLGTFKRVDGSAQARDSDGYATGLAVHLLLRHGSGDTKSALNRGLEWLRSHQRPDGSWPGRSLNKERDPKTMAGKLMTDAATAIAALAVTEAASR